jgi:AcrR family transcriptional regulator
MSQATTRAVVLAAAKRLFAERGYQQVTIRQIATEASISPAMVMKVCGNKEKLYADATPPESEPLSPDWPTDQIGRELARRIMGRRETESAEPWLQSLIATLDAPNPAKAREEFRNHYVVHLERRIGPGPKSTQSAELAAAMLIGLAAAVRALRLLDDPAQKDSIIDRYGDLIQSVVDDATVADHAAQMSSASP